MLIDLTHGPDKEPISAYSCSDFTPLVALRELQVRGSVLRASPAWLTNVLAAVTSAPELSLVHFEFDSVCNMIPEVFEEFVCDYRWTLVDRWLAHLVRGRGQLSVPVVVLSIPFRGEPPKLGTFLSESRGAGVDVKVVNLMESW